MADDHPTKLCTKCETVLPVAKFGINRAGKDGLTAYCRTCFNLYAKERRTNVAAHGHKAGSGVKILARQAVDLDRMVTVAKAAKHQVTLEHKTLAGDVLKPALAALRAAVSLVELLMGPPAAEKPSERASGTAPADPAPPPIREIRTIIVEDGVSRAKANRIQEREILTRAEWRPSISAQ